MFDFDVGKLLVIGIVALIFIPPKDLPAALRQLGRLVGQARRVAAEFQSQFNEALREAEFSDIKQEFAHLKTAASLDGAMNSISEIAQSVEADKEAEQAIAALETARQPAPESVAAEPAALPPSPAQLEKPAESQT